MHPLEIDIIDLQEGDEFWGDKVQQQGTLKPRLVYGTQRYWTCLYGAMRQREDPEVGDDDTNDVVRAHVRWFDGGQDSRVWAWGTKIWIRRKA